MRVAARRRRQVGRATIATALPLAGPAADIDTSPPPERGQHDRILPPDQTIADERGAIGRPFRVCDTLAKMLGAGSIDERQQAAGDRFRDDFDLAHLHGLRAADISRPIVDGRPQGDAAVVLFAPRERVWRAIGAAGGMTSAGGSCLWHVVGEGCSLAEWALLRQAVGKRVNKDNASGILVAALDVLIGHYAAGRR